MKLHTIYVPSIDYLGLMDKYNSLIFLICIVGEYNDCFEESYSVINTIAFYFE